MSDLKPKQPVSPSAAVSIVVILIIIFLIFKCSCNESESNNDFHHKNLDTDIPSEYNNNDSINQQSSTKEPTSDELFEVYHYIYSKGNVVNAETNVLFVDGKNDELQITVDMPNGKTYEYYLNNKVSLGLIKGMDSYMYTSDNNEKINVFFKDGRKMMGMVSGKEDFVFMNTPNYKE